LTKCSQSDPIRNHLEMGEEYLFSRFYLHLGIPQATASQLQSQFLSGGLHLAILLTDRPPI
jgi:hypothetical protein